MLHPLLPDYASEDDGGYVSEQESALCPSEVANDEEVGPSVKLEVVEAMHLKHEPHSQSPTTAATEATEAENPDLPVRSSSGRRRLEPIFIDSAPSSSAAELRTRNVCNIETCKPWVDFINQCAPDDAGWSKALEGTVRCFSACTGMASEMMAFQVLRK